MLWIIGLCSGVRLCVSVLVPSEEGGGMAWDFTVRPPPASNHPSCGTCWQNLDTYLLDRVNEARG